MRTVLMKSYLMKNEEGSMKNCCLTKMFAVVIILCTTCASGFADDHRGEVAGGYRFPV